MMGCNNELVTVVFRKWAVMLRRYPMHLNNISTFFLFACKWAVSQPEWGPYLLVDYQYFYLVATSVSFSCSLER